MDAPLTSAALSVCPSSCVQNKKKKASVPVNACGVSLFCQGGRPAQQPLPQLNTNKAVKHRQQTSPITVPIQDMFQGKVYPYGELLAHGGEFNTKRISDEELRAQDRPYDEGLLAEMRESAEVHRQVRQDFMRWVQPGKTMIECAQYIENGVRTGLKADKVSRLERGFAFPTGLSVNHVAAHYSPNYKDTQVLRQGDVMKVGQSSSGPDRQRVSERVAQEKATSAWGGGDLLDPMVYRAHDSMRFLKSALESPAPRSHSVCVCCSCVRVLDFGAQVKGHIIDCAFTLAFEERFDPLLNAVKEATNAGLKAAGIDVRLCDIGGEIEEVMQSHEIELNGITYPIKSIRNLNGHNIIPYKIHGGKVRNRNSCH